MHLIKRWVRRECELKLPVMLYVLRTKLSYGQRHKLQIHITNFSQALRLYKAYKTTRLYQSSYLISKTNHFDKHFKQERGLYPLFMDYMTCNRRDYWYIECISTKKIYKANLHQKRLIGRPKARWKRNVEKDI